MWDTAAPRGANCDDATEGKCVLSAAAGPYCLCKNGAAGGQAMGYCRPPMSTPEQINLQYAAADVVVVAFVTYEKAPTTAPPAAMFGEAENFAQVKKQLTGVTHWYAGAHQLGVCVVCVVWCARARACVCVPVSASVCLCVGDSVPASVPASVPLSL